METVQFGKYEASEEIGRGGMSIVYRGKHPTLNKDVAIKVLSEFLSGDKNFIKRFQEEARLLSSFRHANIVSILDYGKQDSNYYIVMDLIEGFTVKQMILETGPLSLNIATNIIKNVATALAYTHRKSIIHQDIKSSNIMVDNNGRVLVTDFGLSRNISLDNSEANTSEIAGTLSYSAPEQLDRKLGKLDARTDIYSLGIVFYEMVTGKLPFADENTTVNIAYQHLNVIPESPKKIRPDLLLKSSSIIMRMLKKKQADRYQTMEELLKDIRELEDVLQYYRPSEEEEEGSFFSFQPDDADDSTLITEESQNPIVFSSENKDEDSRTEEKGQSLSAEKEVNTNIATDESESEIVNEPDSTDAISTNDSDPFIGKELKHRYRIQKLVLRRILSRLYYAVDLVKDIPVTVQLPNESRPTFKTRINREIQTMRKINHPGFVKFLDIVEENGVNFVIREYVDGYTVKNLLKREQLSIKKSVQISLDVLDALSYLHKKGIIHRDLNSDVVIVPKKGRTRISSLGFTRVEDASSVSSGEFLGVVQYTAPEQITQSFSDVRTDIYAVGILLFEMLSGTPPFDSPLPVEVMDMHLKRVPRFPEESQKGIPLTLQRIVLKALSKQPEQRFQSAEEMTTSLQNFLTSFTGKNSSGRSSSEGDSMDEKNDNSGKKDSKVKPLEVLSDTGIYKNIQVNKNQKKNVAFSIKKGVSAGTKKENKVDIHKIINNGLKTDPKKKEPPKVSSKEKEVYKATQIKKKNDAVGTSPTFTVKPSKKSTKKPIGPVSKNNPKTDTIDKDKKKKSLLPILLVVVIVGLVGYFIWTATSQKQGQPEELVQGTLEWIDPATPQGASLKPLTPLNISLKQPDYKDGNTFEVAGLPSGIEYELSKPDTEGNFTLTLYTSEINPENAVRFSLFYRNSTDELIEKYDYSIVNETDTVKSILLNYENATYKINNGPAEEIAANVLIFKEKIYIPIRFLLSSLDGDLSYDFKEEKIVITAIDSHTYEFFLFKNQYSIDGSTITGVNPILEINDTAYLPIDFLGNRMHFVVVLERNLKDELIIHLLHNKEA